MKLPYLEFKEELDAAYHRVIESGWYILGDEVEALGYLNSDSGGCHNRYGHVGCASLYPRIPVFDSSPGAGYRQCSKGSY